jgi:hypothetical protein
MNDQSPDPVPPAKSPGSPARAADAYREGDYLVVRKAGAKLPQGCIFCSGPEMKRKRLTVRKFAMPAGWAVLLGFAFILMYAVSPVATFEAGLCSSHLRTNYPRSRRGLMLVGIALALVGVGVAVSAVSPPRSAGDYIGAALGFPGMILLLLAVPLVLVTRPLLKGHYSDRRYMWVDGVSPDYLQRLPEIGGAGDSASPA